MKKQVSLSAKLIITMLLLVTGTFVLCWILNNTFLEKYYIYDKQQEIMSGFETLDNASEDETLGTDDFDITFENLCANGNLTVLIIDSDLRNVVRSSSRDDQMLMMQLQEMLRGGVNPMNSRVMISSERYMMLRQTDNRLQSEYLVLWGNLKDGSYIYMKTALESIRESAAITNRFFAMIGLFGIAISVIVIFILAKSISKPMKELSDISKSMSDLNFEVKYIPKKNDSAEIAELGTHMNEMSKALEATISDLKAANIELKQDIEKKEKIDEMRKEFLSNVSHELKTPLALISGYAEGLKEEVNEDPESRDYYCDVIIDESDKMNKMVKKLLTLNQLEFGNDTVEMVRFNVTELIRGLVQANSLLAAQENISIIFEETEDRYVWGDEFKVEEVLTNYLSNAIHYASGEKNICIYYEQKDELLRICVYNSGEPIPEEEQEKIWVKFYKVDKARTREYGGNGIGLSIVKAIMDSMNRACGVENKEDGVVFWLELENGCIQS